MSDQVAEIKKPSSAVDTFTLAHDAFVPAPDDNKEAIPFYRTWFGLKAVWGEEFCKEFHYVLHEISCRIIGLKVEEKYPKALELLQYNIDHQAYPPKPQRRISYSSEPDLFTDKDVEEIFVVHFKARWPEKRINSKFAKEKRKGAWETCQKLALERYERDKAGFVAQENQRERDYQNQLISWQERVDSINKFAVKAKEILSKESIHDH
jgi:hypothetical protein